MADTILIISYYLPPMNGPATQHPSWFFRYLPDYGYRTIALTSSVYPGEPVDEDAALRAADIHRVPDGKWLREMSRYLGKIELSAQLKVGLWEHGFVWTLFAIREALRIIEKERVTAIISTSPSVCSHLAALQIRKKCKNIRWIADFQDPFVGNPFRRTSSLLKKKEAQLERDFFECADYVSANTDNVRDMWRNAYPEYDRKFITTCGGFDPEEEIQAAPIPSARQSPVLAHVGSVYGGRVSEPFIAAFSRLRRNGELTDKDLNVEFVGSNDFSAVANRRDLEELVNNGAWRIHNEYVSRSHALRVSASADYLLILDVTQPHNTKLQVPSKLFDYIRIGRPILAITPRDSPTEQILSKSGIAHVIIDTQASSGAYEGGIMRLLDMPTTPRKPSEWFLRTFDARRLAGRMAEVIGAATERTQTAGSLVY